jgi:hypothetical protein
MKNKHIKKISKKIYKYVENKKFRPREQRSDSNSSFKFNSTTFDEKLSENFMDFVNNILRLDEISIELEEKEIRLYIDLSKFKTISKHQNEENVDIFINKDGFSIRKSYNATLFYSDKNIFDKLLPQLKERNSELTKIKIERLIEEVSIETNILRNSNLEKIMNSL